MLKYLNLVLICLIGLGLLFWLGQPQPELKLVFCSVGQGDATLIIWQDQEILVDGGPGNQVLDCLGRHLPFWDREIELMIASHAEADHITGLIETARRYQVGQFFVVNEVNDTAEYRSLAQVLAEKQVPVREMTAGNQVKLGPVVLTWLWPVVPGSDILAWTGVQDSRVLGVKTSLNDFSQVIAVSYGGFDLLLTGDISSEVEDHLVASVRQLAKEIEVLKVAHHGSKYSSGRSFLGAVSPELAVIGVGKNSYGHPTPETLNRLLQAGANVKRTDLDGDVVVTSDGRGFRVLE